MIEIIKEAISNRYVLSVLMFLIMIFKVLIDHWNITSVERVLMTDLQKFLGFVSNLVFFSLPMAVFSALFIWQIGEHATGTENASDYDLNVVVWGVFLVTFIFLFIFTGTLILIGNSISLKKEYFIKMVNDNDNWKIVRRSDKNTILIINEKKESKFINNWVDKTITSSLKADSMINKVYQINKRFRVIIVALIILFLTFLALTIFINNELWTFLTFVLTAITFVIFLLILINKIEYKRLKF